MRQIGAAVIVAALLAGIGHLQAQASGVAIVTIAQGNPFSGFFGPWRITPTGVELLYHVLCYDTFTRAKRVRGDVIVAIPDGSTLQDLRTLVTTRMVEVCAEDAIVVSRGSVLLPAMQFGQ